MACSGNLVNIALCQLQNVKIALATLRQFFYNFHLTLSNFPQIALQSMQLLVLITRVRGQYQQYDRRETGFSLLSSFKHYKIRVPYIFRTALYEF